MAAETDKPNIVLIVADDLGYADLGCQGSTDIVSPHIDSLAESGIRFTQGYVSAPQCVPSRAGLMTGRDQNRFGAESNTYGHTFGDERTIAEYLKDAGYVTGMAGKWHGYKPGDRPFDRGFDECFWNNGGGILFPDPETGFLKNHFRNAEPIQEREYSTDAYGREALAFIDRHAGGRKPFYFFLSFVPPHWPMEAKPEHMQQFAHVRDMHRRTMLAMTASMDENIGRVLARIREKGVEENTLIFFLSDNGGPTGNPRTNPDAPFQYGQNTSRNDPLRGMKGNLLEGGIRVPFLAQWKGVLPKGAVYDEPVTAFDIGATALALAGVEPEPALDGVNLMPFLLGKEKGAPHERLFWRFRFDPKGKYPRQWAVREGDWKLLEAWREAPALYNLAADIAENQDLIEQNPEVATRLRAAYLEWEREVDREHREQNLPRADASPQRSGGGYVKIKIAPSHCAASSDPVFAHPEQWSEVAEAVDAYMIFHTMLPTMPEGWIFKKVDPKLVAGFLKQNKGIRLEVEAGPFDERHTDAERGFGARAVDSIAAKVLEPLRERGITVSSLTLDSTMAQLVRGYDLNKENLASHLAEVAAFVRGLKARYPDLHIGVVTCPRNSPWTEESCGARQLPPGYLTGKSGIYYRTFAESLLQALADAGTRIDFLAVECPYDLWRQRSEKAGRIVTFADEYREIQAWCAEHGLEFEVVVNAHPVPQDFKQSITPPESEEEDTRRSRVFHEGVLAYIRDLHVAEIHPDSFKIQSWYTSPSRYLPETDPGTFMNTAREAIRLIERLYPCNVVRMPTNAAPVRRPTLGVIRWDMYTGHPFTTQKQEFGFLKPEQYHWRAPFFVRRTGDPEKPLSFNLENRPEVYQEAMEQEIEFAAGAGIDYWAFGYAGPGIHVKRGLHEGLDAYLASPQKEKIHFCVIVHCPGVAAVKFYEPPSVRHTEEEIDASWKDYVEGMIKLAKEPRYQRVLDGRPLVYLYQPRFLGEGRRRELALADRVDRCLRLLREQFNAAGVGNPYLAHMVDTRKPEWERLFDQGLVDCVTLYHHRYAGDNLPYGTLWGHIRHSVLQGAFKRPDLKVIPPTMSGANGMPRYTGPGGAFPKWDWTEPAPGELATHLTGALDYVAAHREKCEANTVIMYAWNEHSEGGFICPTMGEAPDYKPVTGQLDELSEALRLWMPPTAKGEDSHEP